MKLFQKITTKLPAFMLSLSFFLTSENLIYSFQSSPEIGFDSTGMVVAVWLENNGGFSFVQGYYGPAATAPTTPPPEELSNAGTYNASGPIVLKIAEGPIAVGGATAIAVYSATDNSLSNESVILLLSRATTSSGWSQNPVVISADDGSESPNGNFRIEMLDDGTKVIVIWASTTGGANVIRYAVSTDGGVSFSAPVTAPL